MIKKICFITLLITNHAYSMDLESQLKQLSNQLVILEKILANIPKKIVPPPPATIIPTATQALKQLIKYDELLNSAFHLIRFNINILFKDLNSPQGVSFKAFNEKVIKEFNNAMALMEQLDTYYKTEITKLIKEGTLKDISSNYNLRTYEIINNAYEFLASAQASARAHKFSDTNKLISQKISELRDEVSRRLAPFQEKHPLEISSSTIYRIYQVLADIENMLDEARSKEKIETINKIYRYLQNVNDDFLLVQKNLKSALSFKGQITFSGKDIQRLEENFKNFSDYMQRFNEAYEKNLTKKNDWNTVILDATKKPFKESIDQEVNEYIPQQMAALETLIQQLKA